MGLVSLMVTLFVESNGFSAQPMSVIGEPGTSSESLSVDKGKPGGARITLLLLLYVPLPLMTIRGLTSPGGRLIR